MQSAKDQSTGLNVYISFTIIYYFESNKLRYVLYCRKENLLSLRMYIIVGICFSYKMKSGYNKNFFNLEE